MENRLMSLKQKMLNRIHTKPHVFKPTDIPPGFVLVRDTREQLPLFTRTKGLTVKVDTLHHGDYTIDGFQDQFAIERKQESDFYSYIGKERKKTIIKLGKLSTFKFAALVVEGLNIDDLCVQSAYSTLTPEHVRGFLVSISVRYGIHFFAHRDRKMIERWILDRSVKFYNMMRSGG